MPTPPNLPDPTRPNLMYSDGISTQTNLTNDGGIGVLVATFGALVKTLVPWWKHWCTGGHIGVHCNHQLPVVHDGLT